ncbi:MAG: signal peptidase I [Candidatus Colwellbacteria bacterium]|nr:signal peptidase I [Candidatus Colwellbacteria bacterium]
MNSKKKKKTVLGTIGEITLYTILGIVAILFIILPMFGFRSNKMWTDSMKPAISTGDMVFTAPVPIEQIKVGDIIISDAPKLKDPIIHRVYSRSVEDGNIVLETKGDALEEEDECLTTKDDFLGKAYLVIPYLGYVSYFLANPYVIAFAGWSIVLAIGIKKVFKKKDPPLPDEIPPIDN